MSKDRTGFENFEKAKDEFNEYEKRLKDYPSSGCDDDSTIHDMDYEDY